MKPKIEEKKEEKKNVRVIEYEKTQPSQPPWTTYNGRIHARPDSWEAKELQNDAQANAFVIERGPKKGWISGIWYADNHASCRENEVPF